MLDEAEPTLTFNEGQTKASEGFFEFLLTDEVEMAISGPGGVGKTFWMGQVIDKIIPQYLDMCSLMGIEAKYTSVKMTATTNKAAEVLAHSTNRPTETIHSFLNLKVYDDFNTGKSKLIKTRNFVVHEKMIIFIDECSMIDTDLLTLLHEGTHNCKIVYIGDHCQLAPIMEPISPVFNRKMRYYELTEPMRTNDPDLQALNLQLRETVETGIFKPIKIIPGVIDLVSDVEMSNLINNHFTEQTIKDRILAYTNKRVIEYNDHIRLLRQLPDEYTVGEILVNNSAVRHSRGMLSVEDEVEIIAISPNTSYINYGKHEGTDLLLEVYDASLKNQFGEILNMQIPVDRQHFDDLIKFFKKMKNWSTYYNMKQTIPDLRQRDAGTVHKAQGSTLETVFIDADNLSGVTNPAQAARMLYVACSRARKRIVFYGQLTNRFGGFSV